jgi:peptidoglycan hydrolase-like protein with peptidoglycan-binding domain
VTGVRRRRRAGRLAVAVVLAVAVGGAAAAAAGVDLGSGQQHPSTAVALPPATGNITRQTLVDTQTETGELGYGDATTLTGRLAGTVTALPAVGTTVRLGDELGRVDNAPILLLYGALPAYRALSTGTRGPDVKQFEQNLYALGYRGFTVDDRFTASTAKAVKAWQKELGLTKTGIVELGRVFYATGPIRVDARKANLGDAVQAGVALLTSTGTSRVAVVNLDGADQRLAKLGAAVSILLPGGQKVTGKVVKVEAGTAGTDGTAKTIVALSISQQQPVAGLADEAPVDVSFTVSERKNVLSVPVAALLAVAEGGYGVEVVTGDSSKVVAVKTGLFAAGRVEVSGAGLAEGLQVGMPS